MWSEKKNGKLSNHRKKRFPCIRLESQQLFDTDIATVV